MGLSFLSFSSHQDLWSDLAREPPANLQPCNIPRIPCPLHQNSTGPLTPDSTFPKCSRPLPEHGGQGKVSLRIYPYWKEFASHNFEMQWGWWLWVQRVWSLHRSNLAINVCMSFHYHVSLLFLFLTPNNHSSVFTKNCQRCLSLSTGKKVKLIHKVFFTDIYPQSYYQNNKKWEQTPQFRKIVLEENSG